MAGEKESLVEVSSSGMCPLSGLNLDPGSPETERSEAWWISQAAVSRLLYPGYRIQAAVSRQLWKIRSPEDGQRGATKVTCQYY